MILVNNRDSIEWKKGITVQEVLTKMGYDYALITVTVNGELVPHESYDTYKVPDNGQMSIFHLAHGG
jgi:thiamine biosynthesis protein ThiS